MSAPCFRWLQDRLPGPKPRQWTGTMQTPARRLAFRLNAGMTILIILFPPFIFSIGGLGAQTEYDFLLTGSPSAARAAARFGSDPAMSQMKTMFKSTLDIVRLAVELAVVWGVYLALTMTVLARRQRFERTEHDRSIRAIGDLAKPSAFRTTL